jgi:hypothetical protein
VKLDKKFKASELASKLGMIWGWYKKQC